MHFCSGQSYIVGEEVDLNDVIHVWCNITYVQLIAGFSNDNQSTQFCNSIFKTSNTFQTGNLLSKFQISDGSLSDNIVPSPDYGLIAYTQPQRLIPCPNPTENKKYSCSCY